MPATATNSQILIPGRNCWRIEHADRVAFLVDAADYFSAFHTALENARYSILILGWDIDSRLKLVQDERPLRVPKRLGEFLNFIAAHKRGLHINVLTWDYAMIFAMEREWVPLFRLKWKNHRRLHYRTDNKHPTGASHHQKVVVVDDSVAFVGGLDLSKSRWDTHDHLPHDARRIDPDGSFYPPFHDVQMMVDADAAAALGELARDRWYRATGQRIPPPPINSLHHDPWPQSMRPDIQNVSIALARTEPQYNGRPEVREVEHLYLDTIAAAKHSIYIENQYFSSYVIGKALAERLAEPDGPEIVIVLPLKADGWLTGHIMDVLRSRLVKQLEEADRFYRLRMYYPYISGLGDEFLNVHSKVMIVDNTFLRIGSSNLNNRSMGLDTECDLALEAGDDPQIKRNIVNFRNQLLAEHLHVTPENVALMIEREDSLIRAIEQLRSFDKTLKPLHVDIPPTIDNLVPDPEFVDPERPIDPNKLATYIVSDEERKPAGRQLLLGAFILVMLLALGAAWRWTPLGHWLEVEKLAQYISYFKESPLAPVLVIIGFIITSLVLIPVTVLIAATILTFGPVLGFIYALLGSTISAAVFFGIGHLLGRNTIHRLTGTRLHKLSRRLAERGLLAVILSRVIPVGPFTIVNLIAGASHIRFRDFALGTIMGMAPGMFAITLFIDQLVNTVRQPQITSFLVLVLVAVTIAIGAFLFRKWLLKRAKSEEHIRT